MTFLGTADARLWSREVNTTALLVCCGHNRLLVDCGRGAVQQLARAGQAPRDLAAVLLTHWHPDHVAGLPRLLRHLAAPAPDRQFCLYAPAPPVGVWRGLQLVAGEGRWLDRFTVQGGDTVRLGGFDLVAVAADHGIQALAWAVEEHGGAGRRVVISGDTRPTPTIAAAARGADLLIHEATYMDHHRRRAHARGHSTALEAATLAREAGVGALAITHVPARYARLAIVAEARRAFGPVFLPDDLDRLRVSPREEPCPQSPAFGWGRVHLERE